MSCSTLVFLIFHVLGGMALFIFGMHIMTNGLRVSVGSTLRTVLARTARSRLQGITLGTLLGFLAHSGAATVMIAGFINAGLMSLPESIPPIMGASLGTSLSMQLVSFDLARYCFIAISLGFGIRMVVSNERTRELGSAVMGFGLLFLGISTISAAIAPHRELLAPALERINGDTFRGTLYGVAMSALLTALITSSGATIGLCFALISAGVFTRFEQVFPLVLGSHIGTCVVALTAGLAMNMEARRSAVWHLSFNVLNVALALAAYPWIQKVIFWSSSDLTRQTANLHTLVILGASLMVLPFSKWFAQLMRLVVPSKQPAPEPSHLRDEFLHKPEQAICAIIRELHRMSELCLKNMFIDAELILKSKNASLRKVYANEDVINEVKRAMTDYLSRLTSHYLSRRQTLFIQHLDRCMTDIERIGDHLKSIGEISIQRLRIPEAIVEERFFQILFDLFCSAKKVLRLVSNSLNPDNPDFQTMALDILKARDVYMIQSIDVKAEFAGAAEEKAITPIGGYFMNRYVSELDRLVKHAKSIALAERQPDFWIKRMKLERPAKEKAEYKPPPLVKPEDYLDQLQREDYI